MCDKLITQKGENMSKPIRYVFKDGLELFYRKCKANNATQFVAGLRMGSYDNGKTPGLAHFFEHMMFKGTKKHSVEELNEIRGQRISSFNAHTSNKFLWFDFYESNKRLEEGMKLTSEMIFDSIFPEEELEKEKGVIKQEYFRTKDNDIYFLIHKLLTAMVNKLSVMNVYDSVFGTPEQIDSYNRKNFMDFRKKYLYSNNFVVSASGSMPFRKFKRLVRKYFNDRLEENPKLKTFDEKTLKISGKPCLIVEKRDREKISYVVFIKNNTKNPFSTYREEVIYGLIVDMMNSPDGKLWKKLREEKGLTYSSSSSSYRNNNNGAFGFRIETTADKVNESLDAIRSVVIDYLNEGFKAQTLKELKESIILDDDKIIKSPNKWPLRAIRLWDDYNRFIKRKEYIKTLKTVTLQEVNIMFRRLFCQTNDVYFGIIGKVEEKDFYSYNKIRKIFNFRKYSDKKTDIENSDVKVSENDKNKKTDHNSETYNDKSKVKNQSEDVIFVDKKSKNKIKDKKK